MTKIQFATGSVVTLLIVLAAFVATRYVNDRIPDQPDEPPSANPCVDAGGGWRNWSWPNVPWLSPPCKQDAPPRQQG